MIIVWSLIILALIPAALKGAWLVFKALCILAAVVVFAAVFVGHQ